MSEYTLVNVVAENPFSVDSDEAYAQLMQVMFDIGCEVIWTQPEKSKTYIFVNWHHSNWERLNGTESD